MLSASCIVLVYVKIFKLAIRISYSKSNIEHASTLENAIASNSQQIESITFKSIMKIEIRISQIDAILSARYSRRNVGDSASR